MLKKKIGAATVAAAIGIACLFPAIAQARPVNSGLSDEFSSEDIDLSFNTSVADINSLDSVGEFPGAIKDFKTSGNPDTNLTPLSFTSGDLRISRLVIDPNNNEVLPIIKGDINSANINFSDLSPSGTFNNDWLRGDVTFPNTTDTLTLFIPSNDSSVINSLSALDRILNSGQVQAVLSRPDVGRVEKIVASNAEPDRKALDLPEPSVTGSLLGLGAIGAVSLLKRNQRLKKAVELNVN